MNDAGYIDIHTHRRREGILCLVSYGLGRDIIPPDPERPFSAGIHPWDAAGVDAGRLKEYLDYLRQAPLIAIGEAGLDYVRGGEREKQKEIFKAQLEVAQQRSLPVIIHCVRAHNDLLPMLLPYPGLDFILHGYIGSPELTARAVDMECYFSIGERSLNSAKTVKALQSIPQELIFAETDESTLPIEDIYKGIAAVKKTGVGELKEAINDNYRKIFG